MKAGIQLPITTPLSHGLFIPSSSAAIISSAKGSTPTTTTTTSSTTTTTKQQDTTKQQEKQQENHHNHPTTIASVLPGPNPGIRVKKPDMYDLITVLRSLIRSVFEIVMLVPVIRLFVATMRWCWATSLKALDLLKDIILETYEENQRRNVLLEGQAKAKSYREWSTLALELDRIDGNEIWKQDNESEFFDYELIEQRLYHLKHVYASRDIKQMVWNLRTELHRSLGGINNPNLYRCHTGSKILIEQYMDQVCEMLHYIRKTDFHDFDLQEKFKFFRDTTHALGRSALLLSGGGSLGMYHIGVVKALFEQKLFPRIISGSSAGALVAALFCVKTDEEIPQLFELKNIRLDAFANLDKGKSTIRKISRFFKSGVLMDITKLQDCMRENMGDITFEEAFQRTGRILNITVNSTKKFTMPSLLNYLTAPHVLIWSAACASCALPGVYKPVPLMAKDHDGNIIPYHPSCHKFSDGSFWADLPLQRLSELFNVNLFIVSQCNPHVIPFLSDRDEEIQRGATAFSKAKHFLLSEARYRILQLYEYNLLPKKLDVFQNIISQRYTGDLTILPANFDFESISKVLTNPSLEYMEQCALQGQRRTWPKMSIIRNHCRIERKVDECMHVLKQKLLDLEGCPPNMKTISSFSSICGEAL